MQRVAPHSRHLAMAMVGTAPMPLAIVECAALVKNMLQRNNEQQFDAFAHYTQEFELSGSFGKSLSGKRARDSIWCDAAAPAD